MQKQLPALPFGFGCNYAGSPLRSLKHLQWAAHLRPDSDETESLPGQLLKHHMKFQLGELDRSEPGPCPC